METRTVCVANKRKKVGDAGGVVNTNRVIVFAGNIISL
jgi:hypothetical protein